MKKRIVIITLLAVLLVACGGKVPPGMDKQTYNLGMEAITWCERYEQNKITAQELHDEMSEIMDKLDALEISDSSKKSKNIMVSSDLLKISGVSWKGNTAFYEGYDSLKNRLGLK